MSQDIIEADDGAIVYKPILNRSKKVRFYIPTEKEDADKVVEAVVIRLSTLFGGATAIPGQGSYIMDDGELCQETVTLVESFASDMETSHLTSIAMQIKEDLDEESVAFEIDRIESAFI